VTALNQDINIMQIIGLLAMAVLPLISFFLLIFVGKKLKEEGGILSTILQGISAISAWIMLFFSEQFVISKLWFSVSNYNFSIGILADEVALWMAVIVTTISFLVHLFSLEYMRTDQSRYRYFALLGLFTFAMLGIVFASNVLLIFVFWELVGLSSYLLIGFWYKKPEAAQASHKAFIMNRIGDVGFLIGIMALWAQLGSLDIISIHQYNFESVDSFWLTIAGLGILSGVIGKSTQFPLQTWLPDAMEGPTPVSALIHAATMVAAGVYLLVRLHPIFNPTVLQVMMILGGITALMAALAALAQNDIKKVLAYSTVSQLGYMVMAAGAGAFGTAFFHLSTHAFFKAGLFLAAGSVIYSLHHWGHENKIHFDGQDMRQMGGLRKQLPKTFITYTIFAATLCGLPFFTGFLSKEGILVSLWNQKSLVGLITFALAIITAFITPLYIGRQWFMVFMGESRQAQPTHKIEEACWMITFPLILLAFCSLGLFISLNPFHAEGGWLFHKVTFLAQGLQTVSLGLLITNLISIISGLGLAYWLYGRKSYNPSQDIFQKSWLIQHFYQDHFYQKVIVQKLVLTVSTRIEKFDRLFIDRIVNGLGILHVVLGHIIAWIDKVFVDGLVNAMAWLARRLGNRARSWQMGNAQSFIAGMVFVCIIVLIWMVI